MVVSGRRFGGVRRPDHNLKARREGERARWNKLPNRNPYIAGPGETFPASFAAMAEAWKRGYEGK